MENESLQPVIGNRMVILAKVDREETGVTLQEASVGAMLAVNDELVPVRR